MMMMVQEYSLRNEIQITKIKVQLPFNKLNRRQMLEMKLNQIMEVEKAMKKVVRIFILKPSVIKFQVKRRMRRKLKEMVQKKKLKKVKRLVRVKPVKKMMKMLTT